jgi:hypothetical protein
LDDDIYKLVKKWKWRVSVYGYALRTDGKGKNQYLHRLVYTPQKPLLVDHINHDKLDDQRVNLRGLTIRQNVLHRHNRTSGFIGVCRKTNRDLWMCTVNGQLIGYFKNRIHAAMAYDIWAPLLLGDTALNFPTALHNLPSL